MADAIAPVESVVRQILAVIPGGCTWLLPVRDEDGHVVDFRIAAAGAQGRDIYGRGAARVDARLSELYPSMVDGALWQTYCEVLASGLPGQQNDFRYEETRAGIVADSVFDVSVYPMLGGLLVWWQRLDEDRRRLRQTELLGRLGWAEYDLATGVSDWSPGMYLIFERDLALGPMSRAEQTAAVLPDDRGLSETAWQTLDSGAASDVTVRFRCGAGVKYLRVLSDLARDADGNPLKIYAVVQDITAREDTRTEIQRLSDQLRKREITALAEHRLAGQLQNMIQPVPAGPFPLAGLEAIVSYLPAESAVQVGGDWYHAQDLPDETVVLAIGDVAGHGLEAASGMAHLRYGLQAWLSIGIRDPGVLVGHLNRLCSQLRITATAVVAVFNPATSQLHWARAGHLPPLRARAGVAEPLDQPPGLLLGATPEADYEVRDQQLCPGDLVLFYTDGLVERRSTGLLDQVRDVLGQVSTKPGPQAVHRLRELLSYASPYDDTCTLAIRVLG
jgi:serine phosphatase RsbU (regulator of sigma subunit)